MSDTNKKILLICYSFPPFLGIGGRRWAKFSKYLAKDNFEIHAIGALNREDKNSPWFKDVENNERIHYYPVKTRFYNFFHNYKPSISNKIAYKINKFQIEKTQQGNFYDKALPSNELFYRKAKILIEKHHIKNIVITIAPNRLVEVGEKLKREFPAINLIIDVRDPWNICNEEWDHKFLTEERKKYEVEVEKKALQVADKVFTVGNFMTNYYYNLFNKKNDKFITIPNGFDTEEIDTEKNEVKNISDKKTIVFAGTLYDNVTETFEEFVQSVNELGAENKLFSNIEFKFYIHRLPQFEKIVEKHQCSNITFSEHLPLAQIQKVIGESFACMLFLSPNYEFSLSTKFFEYISKDKKILVFSKPGEVPDLVKKHHLGYVMSPGTIKANLEFALNELCSGKELEKHTFQLQNYSVENITNNIKQYFI